MSLTEVLLYSFKEVPWKRSKRVILCLLFLSCGPGGIAGHVEQHCTQVWHHTQRAGSAEQAVLQGRGAWPGVNRHARLHRYIELHLYITAVHKPHDYRVKLACTQSSPAGSEDTTLK